MRRRRRRNTPSNKNRWLTLVQILILGGVLLFIIFFRDTLSTSAGNVFDSVTGSDVRVEKKSEKADKGSDLETPEGASADDSEQDAGASSSAGADTGDAE